MDRIATAVLRLDLTIGAHSGEVVLGQAEDHTTSKSGCLRDFKRPAPLEVNQTRQLHVCQVEMQRKASQRQSDRTES
jgi:hypothetical protein